MLLLACVMPDSGALGDSAPASTPPTDSGLDHSGDPVETVGGQDTGRTDSSGGDSGGDDSAIPGESGDSATSTGGDSGSPVLPSAPIVVWATRHCEKASSEDSTDDPGLTEEGAARAEALAELLHDEPLVATYATDKRRTQETVQPTADDHGLAVQTELDPEEELADWILSVHGGETVLHAGHSYTLPDFFEAIGIEEVPEVDDYGQLWRLDIDVDGIVTVTESRYGD